MCVLAVADASESYAARACLSQNQNRNFSRVSEVTLGPFVGFLCYVVGTKLGGVLLLRMREMMYSVLPLQIRQKAMQLVLVISQF